jgi:cyanophycin synthetase
MLAELDWLDEPEFASLRLTGGISLGFTAPIDTLYAASEVNEWALAACAAEFLQAETPDFAATAATLKQSLREEINPELIALQSAAANHGVTFLWDDDQASLGLGKHSRAWPVRELPDPAALDWHLFADIPVGIVTGTNGKTTSVRLAAHILQAAGSRTGFSSTDYIAVGQQIVDRDDWSGPGGARSVLRQAEVEAAVLETARGGLLRRGLGVNKADAALITNIARDHLGDFGSRSLDELLQVKWIVSRAVVEGGALVLNADDERLVGNARGYPGKLVWFSLDPENPVVTRHTAEGGAAFIRDESELVFIEGGSRENLLSEREIPIAVGGAARHNVANALAAAALTWSMGAGLPAIRDGLKTMSQDDNPGRGNLYAISGFTVLVDFAHNPQAIQSLFDMAARLPAKRRVLCFGQAGDRPDDLIRELARNAWESGLERVHVSELAKYHRGRAAGEVFELIRDELIRCGANDAQIEHHDEEIESLEAALAQAEPGDLIIMLALERSQPVYDKLQALATN